MRADEFEDVLRFWFPELSSADHARMVRQWTECTCDARGG